MSPLASDPPVADLQGATDRRRRGAPSCYLVLNFDRSTVKHALQKTENDCHQWLSRGFRVHQIRFRPRLRPGPRWGSLQRFPDPLAGLRGTLLLRGWGEEGEEEGSKGSGRGKGRGQPPPKIFWPRPALGLFQLQLQQEGRRRR